MLDKKIQRIGNISGRGALFSKLLKTRYSCDRDGRFEYHNPYELQKFILQMGNESGYGSKKS